MKIRATAFAPASVGNAGVGFDILGFAIDGIGDTITIERTPEHDGVRIVEMTGLDGVPQIALPAGVHSNTAGVSVLKMKEALGITGGFDMRIRKGIAIGSGMGGSAASAVASAFAFNALLDNPLPRENLLPYILEGELIASGSAHPDNIAPSLLGGLVLTVSMQPWKCVSIPVPHGLTCVLVHPAFRLDTSVVRNRLEKQIPLADYVAQSANLAGFISGCFKDDLDLISRCFADVVIEPQRKSLIPGFDEVVRAARDAGAIGTAISGAGPAVFALARSNGAAAENIGRVMQASFERNGISDSKIYISQIRLTGAELVK